MVGCLRCSYLYLLVFLDSSDFLRTVDSILLGARRWKGCIYVACKPALTYMEQDTIQDNSLQDNNHDVNAEADWL